MFYTFQRINIYGFNLTEFSITFGINNGVEYIVLALSLFRLIGRTVVSLIYSITPTSIGYGLRRSIPGSFPFLNNRVSDKIISFLDDSAKYEEILGLVDEELQAWEEQLEEEHVDWYSRLAHHNFESGKLTEAERVIYGYKEIINRLDSVRCVGSWLAEDPYVDLFKFFNEPLIIKNTMVNKYVEYEKTVREVEVTNYIPYLEWLNTIPFRWRIMIESYIFVFMFLLIPLYIRWQFVGYILISFLICMFLFGIHFFIVLHPNSSSPIDFLPDNEDSGIIIDFFLEEDYIDFSERFFGFRGKRISNIFFSHTEQNSVIDRIENLMYDNRELEKCFTMLAKQKSLITGVPISEFHVSLEDYKKLYYKYCMVHEYKNIGKSRLFLFLERLEKEHFRATKAHSIYQRERAEAEAERAAKKLASVKVIIKNPKKKSEKKKRK